MGFVVAIDGPAGSGKGTITKLVAKKCNLVSVDTGAMYRCITLDILNKDIKIEEIEKIKELLKTIKIELKVEGETQKVFLNGEDVLLEIRTEKVNKNVSSVSKIKEVRDAMTGLQRAMANSQDLIMEGRDIGTAVFPNADVKIYLDATAEERASRRYKQNLENGMTEESYEQILESVKERDRIDSTREIAPLVKAEDAILVDSTNMTIEEVVEEVCKIIKEKRA